MVPLALIDAVVDGLLADANVMEPVDEAQELKM
jgi:hypothetical protein